MEWKERSLNSLCCHIKNGASIKQRKGATGLPVTRIQTISSGEIDPEKFGYADIDDNTYARWYLENGDILFSHINSEQHIGKVALYTGAPAPLIHGMNLLCLRPKKDHVFPKWLLYMLRSEDFRALLPPITKRAVNQASISTTNLKRLPVRLPPPSEQRRIVEILDQADALRKKRAEADKIADRILPALFYKMFGDPATNPKGWEIVAFSKACESRLGKMLDAKQQTGEHRRPYLRNANVLWGRFDLSNMLEMDFNPKDRKEFALRGGDLLICEGGEVGRCAIWRDELPECYFQKALHRGRPIAGKATAEYLQQLLWELAKHGGLCDATSHATISHLTGVKLKRLLIPLPPFELQEEFALRVASATKIIHGRAAAASKIHTLFDVLLHRAFSGDLTAKWREAHMKELLQEMEQQAKALEA